ncbi:hypothetical protein DOT_5097 [Desulfosporosinus sp. OT]|nr:hypothetical protein DOT_5097 [Desulfosporosinus sp. OT]
MLTGVFNILESGDIQKEKCHDLQSMSCILGQDMTADKFSKR